MSVRSAVYERTDGGHVRNYSFLCQGRQRPISRCKHCLADEGESVIGEGPEGEGVFVGDIQKL